MANIKKLHKKDGLSFKITVCSGRDAGGKQIRHYRTFVPPREMSEQKAEKEAFKCAIQFEEELSQGYQVDNKETFFEYAEYVMGIKVRRGLKRSTYNRYKGLLERIYPAIGHIRLGDLRPKHLNCFYENLMEEDIRLQPMTAVLCVDIQTYLQDNKMSRAYIAKRANVAASTVRKAFQCKPVQYEKAVAIASALRMPFDQVFVIQKMSEPLTPKTVLEHHRLIGTILAQAEKELIVPYNAASKATPPKAVSSAVNSLQPSDIANVLAALQDEPLKWRLITHLLIVTGARRGEVMGLKWKQLDLNKRVLNICETLLTSVGGVYTDTPKTSGSNRYINMPQETVNLMKSFLAEQQELQRLNGDRWQETGYVFTRDDGRPMNPDSLNGWLREFSERHQLPHLNPHVFRHTMASILINSGTDILTVSKRLGHAMTSTTLNVYGHMVQEADAKASECIADIVLRPNDNNYE